MRNYLLKSSEALPKSQGGVFAKKNTIRATLHPTLYTSPRATRYAATLLLLLCLGVGNAWGAASTSTDNKYISGTVTFGSVGTLSDKTCYWYNGVKFYENNGSSSSVSAGTQAWSTSVSFPSYNSDIVTGQDGTSKKNKWGNGSGGTPVWSMSGLVLQRHCLAVHVNSAGTITLIINNNTNTDVDVIPNLVAKIDDVAYGTAYTTDNYLTGTGDALTLSSSRADATNKKCRYTVTYTVSESDLTDGEAVVKFYYGSSGTGAGKLFCYESVSFTPTPSCTAPNHVDISGAWDRFGGETISLTATAYSSAGTGSPIADANITGWQWQKYYNSTWNNVSNGTSDGVTISGATTKNLQISNCSYNNSGSYRCVVSTGATCSTASGGRQVKVYVLECYNGGTTVYNFTRTGSSQAGTLTIDLSASTAYTFKVHADNEYFGNNGTVNEDVTNWVMCNSGDAVCSTNLTVNSGLGGTFTFGIDYSTGGSSNVEGEPEISVTYPRKRIYLSPGVWDADDAKFAYYYFRTSGGSGWTDFLTEDDCGMYADIPQWNGVKINAVRLNKTTESTGSWGDKWNQTSDITITSNDYVEITGWGSGDSPYDYDSDYSTPTYTISYNTGSTTYTGGNSISGSKSNQTKTCGVDFTLPSSAIFTTTGYTQDGWATSDGGSKDYNLGGSYTTNAAATFYPHWSINTYTLTASATVINEMTEDSKTGAITGSFTNNPISSVPYGTSTSTSTNTFTANGTTVTAAATIAGTEAQCDECTYRFDSWENIPATVTADVNTIHAKYNTTYGISYTLSGGSWADAYSAPTYYVYGTGVTLPISSNIEKEYYNFDKWTLDYDDSDISSIGKAAYGTVAVTAHWTPNTYDVDFSFSNASRSSGDEEGTDAATYGEDFEVVVAASSGYALPATITVTIGGETATSGTAYTWNQGTGTVTIDGDYITGDIEISITSVQTYTVTYNLNGGKYNGGSDAPTQAAVTSGTSITLPSLTPTKSGYVFASWKCSVGNTYHWESYSYTMTAANTTFTAQWVEAADLTSGTLYMVDDIKPLSVNAALSSTGQYAKGISSNGCFTSIGNPLRTDNSDGTFEFKTETKQTVDDIDFTKHMWFKGASAVTSNVPTSRGLKFSVANPGTLTVYCTRGDRIKLSNGSSSAALTDNTSGNIIKREVEIAAAGTYYLYATNGSTGLAGIKFVEETCDDPELAYATDEVEKTVGDDAFTNTLTNTHGVTVSYESSDDAVATVNTSTGAVTIVAAGTCTITASADAQTVSTVDYCADDASYTLTVSNPTYTVTYNTNDKTSGSAPSDTNDYEEGDEVTVKGNTGSLARTGYVFCGWSTSYGGGTFYAPGDKFDMGSANVNLYPVWGQSLNWAMSYSASASAMPTPTKTTSDNTHLPQANMSNFSTSTNVSLEESSGKADASPKITDFATAVAAGDEGIYVTFNVASGYQFTPLRATVSTTATSAAKTIKVSVGSNSQTWAQSKSGSSSATAHEYVFASPSAVSGSGVKVNIQAYGDSKTQKFRLGTPITIYGIVEATGYTISFAGNGNTGGSTASVTSITSGSDVSQITANGFTKNGYSFAGWKTNTALTYVPYGESDEAGNRVSAAVNDIVPDKAKIKNVTSDITLTAQWTEITHTVTVSGGDHGTASTSSVSGVGIATASGNITATPASGYSFSSWTLPDGVTAAGGFSSSSNPIQINATADGKTITATYTATEYTITYTLHDGGAGSVSGNTTYTIEDDDYDLPTPTWSGHVFQGWYDNSSYTGDRIYVLEGGSTGNKTFHAKWGTEVSVVWDIDAVDDKLYKGGGRHTVTAIVDNASWTGSASSLVLGASDGVILGEQTTGVYDEGTYDGKAYVTATFDITEDVEGDAITFYLTAPANGTYGAIEDEEEVDLDACPSGSGSAIEWDFTSMSETSLTSSDIGTGGNVNEISSTAGTGTMYYYAGSSCAITKKNNVMCLALGGASGQGTVNGNSTYKDRCFYIDIASNGTLLIKHNSSANNAPSYQVTSATRPGTTGYSSVSAKGTGSDAYLYEISISTYNASTACRIWVIYPNKSYIEEITWTPSSGGSTGVDTELEWDTDPSSDAAWDTDHLAKEVGNADFTFTASADNNTLGAITYSSSNTSVATVNATTGKVHIVGTGDATITATLAESGCYNGNTATYDITVTSSCSDVAGTVATENLGCEGIRLTVSGYTAGATIAWYKDGYAITPAATGTTYTATAAGTYYAVTTGSCALASNSITIENADEDIDPIIFADEFTVKVNRSAEYRLMQLEEGETIDKENIANSLSWVPGSDFSVDGPDENGVVSIRVMLTSALKVGDGTITLPIKNTCGTTVNKTITIHAKAADAKPQIAWIATGTKGDISSVLADQSTNTALYEALEATGRFDLTPRNCYWTVSEADLIKEYSKYDLVILTDYPNSQTGPNGNGRSKSYTNALGLLIDRVPMLTFEAFVSGCPNWGFESNPKNTKSTQNSLTLLCNANDIFGTSDTYNAGADIKVGDDIASGQALQGFALDAMPNYVFIAKITDSDDNEYVTCCERQENMNARMMVFGLNANVMDNITEAGKNMVIGFVDYLLKDENASIPDCSVIFNGTTDTDWSTTTNWEGNSLPSPYASVRIDRPCVVADGDVAKAGYVKIHVSTVGSTYTGSLTISPQATMIVQNQIYRVVDNDYTDYLPTEAGNLVVQANSSYTGALIFNNNNGCTNATVEMYSPSYWETIAGKKTSYWSYVGVPIQVANVGEYFYGAVTYLYDETSGWIRKKIGSQFHDFEGIGLAMQSGHKETFAGTLASTQTKKITLTKTAGVGEGENMIGNSWTAPIQIANFDASDFGDATATVMIYQTGRDDYEGNPTYVTATAENDGSVSAGQWLAIPINVPSLDGYDGLKVIPAMQAFQVNTSSRTTLTLDYDKLVRGVETDLNTPMRAPARTATSAQREVESVMRVRVSGNTTRSDVWLLQAEQFSDAFDNGWEASYVECDNRSPQFYAQSPLGKMAFIAKQDLEGTVLGFAPSRDGDTYLITFHYVGDEEFYLNDIKLQQSVLIDEENSYTFTYEEGDSNRFYIGRTPFEAPSVTTGTVNLETETPQAIKVIYNDKLYIIRGGRVYSADGQLVK